MLCPPGSSSVHMQYHLRSFMRLVGVFDKVLQRLSGGVLDPDVLQRTGSLVLRLEHPLAALSRVKRKPLHRVGSAACRRRIALLNK